MANEHQLSSAAKPDALDKAYASAVKALSITGIKMATKKPDTAKVAVVMVKTGKSADFMLSCSKATMKLTIECGSTTAAEIGSMLIDLAKRGDQAMQELDACVALKLMSKSDADKLKAGAQTGPDPKVAANELRKKIADIKKEKAADLKISTYDEAKRDKAFFEGLLDFCKSEHSEESQNFIADVEKKVARDKIISQYIGKKAKDEINISDKIELAILVGGDFDDAVKEVKALMARDTMKRYAGRLAAQHDKEIKKLEVELDKLAS